MKKLSRLMRLTKTSFMMLACAALAAFVSCVTALLTPIVVGRAVDAMAGTPVSLAAVAAAVRVLLFLYVVSALAQWGLMLAVNRVGFGVSDMLRRACARKLNTLPVAYIDAHPHGDLNQLLLGDAEKVAEGIIQGLPKLLTGIGAIAGTLVFMLTINAWTAVLVALLTPLSVLVARRITLASHAFYRDQARAQGEISGYAEERISLRGVVAVFGAGKKSLAGYDEINARLSKETFRAQMYGALVNPVTRFVNHLVYIAVGLSGGLLALRGALTVGQVSALLSYANQYTKPFNEISSVVHQIQAASASLDRIFDFLDARDEQQDEEEDKDLGRALGDIVFDGVSFRYHEDRPLIDGFDLRVKPGRKIAIVGKTGAGKTTLVNLLMRFYDVNGGDISLDGVSIYRMPRKRLRRQFAMVLQDSWVYTDTVANNIAFGSPGATEEEIRAAAKAARADAFISRLPEGYQTVIGDKSALSGGQIQLICIARAILNNPPLLILDEATSSVDTRTEMLVSEAFDRMMSGRTSFVIAHRLSTVRTADVILVMHHGRVVEQGTHDELMALGGYYKNMYMSQYDRGGDEE